MKYIIILLLSVFSLNANADSKTQFTTDGSSLEAVQKQIANEIQGSDLKIIHYARAWEAWNPILWKTAPDFKYRTIGFAFKDKSGKEQIYYCRALIVKDRTDLTVYDCHGGDRPLRNYHRLADHGYDKDGLLAVGVIKQGSTGETPSESEQGVQ